MDPVFIVLLMFGGLAAGVINAFAGGGSFITFPLLLLAGLPPQTANATNRVAIVLQCVSGSVTYQRHGVLQLRHLPGILIPVLLGTVPGALLASHLSEDLFRKLSAGLLAAMVLTVFIDSKRWTRESPEGGRIRLWQAPLWFLLGIYGGFLQIGIGTLILGLLVLGGGFDVVRGNALKFAMAAVYNSVALFLFARSGQVHWGAGLILAVGTMTGGALGAHLVVRRGARWVRYVVVVSAAAAVAKLLLS
jgi:uncharacterized membrane protein YfcA